MLVICLLAGCASTASPSEIDEQALRDQADREEERLLRTGKVHEEPLLDEYLIAVTTRLMPTADVTPIRVTVLRDVAPGVFVLPNGRLFVHTGLLARLDSEAQLAVILAREAVHLSERHALRVVQAASEAAPAPAAAPFPAPGIPLTTLAAVTGYGRDLERETDAQSLARVMLAGYDPREAPRFFERLRQEASGPSRPDGYYLEQRDRLDERLAGARKWLQSKAPDTSFDTLVTRGDEYALRTRLSVRENAALELRAGRFGSARRQIEGVLVLTPTDPVAHLYHGDLLRLEAQRARRPEEKAALVEQARTAYERAIALDPAFPDPLRQLGFLYFQIRDNVRARDAFEQYLALRPDGPDARRVKEYLIELER